jgi:hypothetical protein
MAENGLKDLAFSKEEKVKRHKEMLPQPGANAADSGPDYPYGLRMTFEKEALEKLAMKELPKPGDVIEMRVKARVVAVRSNEHEKHGEDRSVELQITHACCEESKSVYTRRRH